MRIVHLLTEDNIVCALSNEFNEAMKFRTILENEKYNAMKFIKIINEYSKYNKWKLALDFENVKVYIAEDSLGNKHYLKIENIK